MLYIQIQPEALKITMVLLQATMQFNNTFMEAEQIKGQSVNKNHQKSLLKNHDAWNEHR